MVFKIRRSSHCYEYYHIIINNDRDGTQKTSDKNDWNPEIG
jgi:hypothetical protein